MNKKSRKERRGAQAREPASGSDESQVATLTQAAAAPAASGAEQQPAGPLEGSPRGRMLANAFIALFLAYQLAMPLRWYLGDRGFDERFSWRMFSTVRMLDCDARVYEAREVAGARRERVVDVGDDVQIAWVKLLERFRSLVVRKVLARRCEHEGVVSARFHLRCKQPDGTPLPDIDRYYECADGVMRVGPGKAGAP